MIRSLSNEFPVKALCRALGVSRSGYYAAQKKTGRPRARDNVRLGAKIKESFEASRRTYGSPRLAVVLRRAGETCGRHRVARLMRVLRLRATQKRRFRPRPTDSRHLCPIAPNHLAGRTELPVRPGFGVAGGHHVRGHQGGLALCGRRARRVQPQDRGLSRRLTPCPPPWSPAPSSAPWRRSGPSPGLLHHSDRGSQYASDAYRELLRRHGVVASMSRAGNCYDNAKMESFWATLKSELIQDRVFDSRTEAKSEIFWYIEAFYNRTRLHGAVGYQSPVDFENSLSY